MDLKISGMEGLLRTGLSSKTGEHKTGSVYSENLIEGLCFVFVLELCALELESCSSSSSSSTFISSGSEDGRDLDLLRLEFVGEKYPRSGNNMPLIVTTSF